MINRTITSNSSMASAIAAKCRTMAHYHDGMRRKWEYFASHPWETGPPLPLDHGECMERSY